jgi:Tfp pilus assembly protein PilN
MKRVDIDFAAPSLRRSVLRTGPGGWSVCVLALLLCASAAGLGWRIENQQRRDQAQLARLRARVQAPSAPSAQAPLTPIAPPQASAVNAAVLQLNLPWRALREAIGAATPAEIALLALEPDPRKRSVKLTAEASGSAAMIAYVEQLKAQELFVAVTLLRHEINDQDANKPIRFQLEATWSAP